MGKMKELDILSRNAALAPCDWCDRLVNPYDLYHKGGECRFWNGYDLEENYTKFGIVWRAVLSFIVVTVMLVLFLSMPIK